MQDGTIPPEMHHHYIGVVLNETERLTKLTNSLLALNNLNTKGMLLQMTDWDINDVIRKVSASFEHACRSKNIRIRLILSGDVLYVHADMDKIQQVLYNLIDNAIKFSNYYSEIEIETTEKKGKVFVSVKDSGIGIPKEDQNQIWERFYKTDLSRGKDKKEFLELSDSHAVGIPDLGVDNAGLVLQCKTLVVFPVLGYKRHSLLAQIDVLDAASLVKFLNISHS